MLRSMLATVVALVALAPSQDAAAEEFNFRLECLKGIETTKLVTCLPGQKVTVKYQCFPDAVVETRELMCPKIAGNWSVVASGFYLDASRSIGGPKIAGFETSFNGHLRMIRDWFWFSFGVAPAVASNGDRTMFGLSDIAALDFRPLRWMSVKLGARHRGVFASEGGNVNSLMGEVGLDFFPVSGLTLGIFGSVGGAWFPLKTQSSTYNPHNQLIEITDTQETGSGFSWAAGLCAGWTFF